MAENLDVPPGLRGQLTRPRISSRASASSSSSPCHGLATSCVDDNTLQVCADLGSGLVPVRTVVCTAPTTLCYSGRCVDALPTTTQAPTRPTPPPTLAPTLAPSPSEDDVCQGRLAVCADCYTTTMCARLGSHVVPVSNRTCGQEAPYCVQGLCRADLPANSSCSALPAKESSFKCYGSGYFPDPADCARYHFCVGGKAYDYQCDGGLVYDQRKALCVPSKQCVSFDCRGRIGSYQLYGPDQTLYALCVTDDSRDALLARCPAGHRLQPGADPLSVRCVPFCAAAGRTADPEDVSGARYYECLASSGGDLVGPMHGSCPQGAVFSADSQRCQPAQPDGCSSQSTAAITAPTEPTTSSVDVSSTP